MPTSSQGNKPRPLDSRAAPTAPELVGIVTMVWLLTLVHGYTSDSLAAGVPIVMAAAVALRVGYFVSGVILLLMVLALVTSSFLVFAHRGFGASPPAGAEGSPLSDDDEAWHPGEDADAE